MHRVQLSAHEAAALNRPVNGQGGFQSLLRSLKANFDARDNSLTLTPAQMERIRRYATDYGLGGFEDRLDGIRRNFPDLIK